MNRREFSTTTGVPHTVVCRGCVTDSFRTSDRSPAPVTERPASVAVQTPPPGDWTPAPAARPSSDPPRTRAHPSVPDTPTRTDGRSLATAFERADQIDARIPDAGNSHVERTAPARATTALRRGDAVGLDARVQPESPPTPPAESPATPTAPPMPHPSGVFAHTVPYPVTGRVASSGEPLDRDPGSNTTPKRAGARTVARNHGDA